MTDVINLVCTLPAQYRTNPNKSPKEIARILGLREHRGEVNAERIYAYLKENTHLLEIWLRWSEEKRWSPAWYFTKREPNWVVGKSPAGPEFIFDDPVQACARFVEIELDDIVSRL